MFLTLGINVIPIPIFLKKSSFLKGDPSIVYLSFFCTTRLRLSPVFSSNMRRLFSIHSHTRVSIPYKIPFHSFLCFNDISCLIHGIAYFANPVCVRISVLHLLSLCWKLPRYSNLFTGLILTSPVHSQHILFSFCRQSYLVLLFFVFFLQLTVIRILYLYNKYTEIKFEFEQLVNVEQYFLPGYFLTWYAQK